MPLYSRFFLFFFSSRRRHTRSDRDWSSDVCSSDLDHERSDSTTLAGRVRSHTGDILFHKHRFDVFTNENVTTVLNLLDPEDIVLYGVATDVCDKAAVEGLLERRPHTRLFVVTDAIRGIDRAASEQLLREWGDEGVRLIRTKEIVEEGLVEALARAPA